MTTSGTCCRARSVVGAQSVGFSLGCCRRSGSGAVVVRRALMHRRTWRAGAPGRDAAPWRRTARRLHLTARPLTPRHDTRYPEWDVHRRRYRPDWCTVIESDAPVDPRSVRDDPRRRRAATLARPTRHRPHPLPSTPPGRRHRHRRRGRGTRRCPGRITARRRLLRREPAPPPRPRRPRAARRLRLGRRARYRRQVGARSPTIGGGRSHRRAPRPRRPRRALCVQLARANGGASCCGSSASTISSTVDVARRIDSLSPAAYTRLGAAIRHGSAILDERAGTSRRLLVVVSDGFAYDHGYEGRYGEADAAPLAGRSPPPRRGLSLPQRRHRRRPGRAATRLRHGVARDRAERPSNCPAMVGPLFRAALRSAEAQRRTFQRKERSKELLEIERSADR